MRLAVDDKKLLNCDISKKLSQRIIFQYENLKKLFLIEILPLKP